MKATTQSIIKSSFAQIQEGAGDLLGKRRAKYEEMLVRNDEAQPTKVLEMVIDKQCMKQTFKADK